MTQVFLIRPGATVYDEQNRVQGILELPLSERGRAEVQALVDRLREVDLEAVYCGPGESVVATAEALARCAGVRAKRIDDFHNLDLGLWQGLQIEEIKRRNPKVYRLWIDEPRTICPPQGETIEDAQERVRLALKPLLRRHREEAIALVIPEPLARLASLHLRREPQVTLVEAAPTGCFECIELDPDDFRNGDGH